MSQVDLHNHTQFSVDAQGTPERTIERAAELVRWSSPAVIAQVSVLNTAAKINWVKLYVKQLVNGLVMLSTIRLRVEERRLESRPPQAAAGGVRQPVPDRSDQGPRRPNQPAAQGGDAGPLPEDLHDRGGAVRRRQLTSI